MAVHLFGENTCDRVVNKAKTCELTRYSAAMYITPNLNNNIVTPTPISSNSVEIIMEALTKCPRFHKPMIGKDVLKYSIVEDLQQIKTNISIAQLAAENPKYLRELKDSFDSPPKLNVGELDEKQQEEFYNLVNEYIDIFAQNDLDLGRTNKI
ncbi:15116_t:CDS:2 [Racocetra fulgida]|uniref:15116_t:CDS:1 n=1 Tax=Racocetra fulgida TaxID=60492 RepID=A0A9N9ARF8_9GLOM|nr:15116_t:CDS:2 [Racocetra fulgida]